MSESTLERALQLLPYHRFSVDKRNYLVNVDRFHCFRLDDSTAGFLDILQENPTAKPAESVRRTLVSCGLIPNNEEKAYQSKELQIERDGRLAKKWLSSNNAKTSSLCLMVAQECNMACVYCFGNEGTYGGGGLMSEETARRCVDWLIANSGENKKLNLNFFGGEPLLNKPVIRSTVDYAKRRGKECEKTFEFSVTTNASLFDEETIAFFRENNFHILISVDGPRTIQDRQRPMKNGKSSYDVVEAKIKRLLKDFPKLDARATLYGDTDPDEVLEGLKKLGFATCHMVPASGCALTDGASEKSLFTREKNRMEDLQREASELVTAVKRRDAARAADLLKDRELSQVVTGRSGPYKVRRLFFCSVGCSYLAVDVDGGIYPCHRFVGMKDYRLGNIGNMKDPQRGVFHESPIVQSKECRKCWLRYSCGGGCLYSNVASTGKPFEPEKAYCLQLEKTTEFMLDAADQLNDEDMEFLYANNVVSRPPCPLDF